MLFVIMAVYLLVGGGIFVGLEGPNERDRIAEARVNQTRLAILRRLLVRNITASGMLNESQAYGIIYLIGNLSVAEANLDTSRNWEFGPAIFFASTVVTTIGKETVHVLYIIPIGPFRLWQYLSCYIWRQTVLHILRDGRHTNSTGLPRFSW